MVKFALGNVKSVCVDCCLSGCTEILPYSCSRCVDDGKCGVSNGVKFSFSVKPQNAHTRRGLSNRLDLNLVVSRQMKCRNRWRASAKHEMQQRGLPPTPSLFLSFSAFFLFPFPLSSNCWFPLLHTFSCCNEISCFCSCCIFGTASTE